MQTFLTTQGIAAINSALTGGPKVKLDGFKLGAGYGYNPDPDESEPQPSPLYTGAAEDLRYWVMEDYDLAVQAIVDSSVGKFHVGNIMLYDGSVSICGGILSEPHTKYTEQVPVRVGNTLVFTIGLNSLSQLDILAAFDFTDMADAYVFAGSAVTEDALPIASSSRASLYNIDKHTTSNAPVLAIKASGDNPDSWLGMSMAELSEVAANSISGGTIGDGY